MRCFVIYRESEINFNYILYNLGVINSKRSEWCCLNTKFTAISIFCLTSPFQLGSFFSFILQKSRIFASWTLAEGSSFKCEVLQYFVTLLVVFWTRETSSTSGSCTSVWKRFVVIHFATQDNKYEYKQTEGKHKPTYLPNSQVGHLQGPSDR